MAVGARPWLERRRLILQPIQPPPTLGTMPNTPYLALTLELLHVSLRTRTGLALAADADGQTTFYLRAAQKKTAASSAQLRRPAQAENRTHLGVLGPLGTREPSILALGPEGWLVSDLRPVVPVTPMVSDNDP